MNNKRKPLSDRFWPKVDKLGHDDCWLWTAGVNTKGYGKIKNPNGRHILAPRVSWELHYGQIPEGLEVCHSCDIPLCVNPRHLWLGTHAQNMADKKAKGRSARGEAIPSCKLSENDIQNIRATFAEGGVSKLALARFFGVHDSLIVRIIQRKAWGHVAPPRHHITSLMSVSHGKEQSPRLKE